MKTTMEIQLVTSGGKRAVRVVVRNGNAAMRDLCDNIGLAPVEDIANTRATVCLDQASLLRVQDALRPYAVGTPVDGKIELVIN
jgi:hypothetical protein